MDSPLCPSCGRPVVVHQSTGGVQVCCMAETCDRFMLWARLDQ